MRKTMKFLSVLLLGCSALISAANAVETKNVNNAPKEEDATTRADAVIFKIHDVAPISEDGIVTGCDFTVTLYNRTNVNFRSFNINLQWNDNVEEKFKFNRYMETFIGADEYAKQKAFIGEDEEVKPLQTSVTVNAFGSDKQISIRSHVNTDKCYLMLSRADYVISPCDIVRSVDTANDKSLDSKECTPLFQFVDTSNPEYFGQFKKISATDIAKQNKVTEKNELSDVDDLIEKIVENLGTSSNKLTNIN